jgi:hypothetical protein
MSAGVEVEQVRFPLRVVERRLLALSVPMRVVKPDFLDGQVAVHAYLEQGEGAGDACGVLFRSLPVAAAGRAIGFLLLGAGQPVAYIYCPVEGRRIVYRYVDFDATHGRLSPGTVLQRLAFEHLFQHRAGYVFDFTEGEGEHKAFFGTDSIE